MKAWLKYEFDLPEEESDMRLIIRAGDWPFALWDVDQKLREWLKYGHNFKTPDEALENIRNFLHEVLGERNLSFDDIV